MAAAGTPWLRRPVDVLLSASVDRIEDLVGAPGRCLDLRVDGPLTPVELTACQMAHIREVERGRPDRLFDDPYAGAYVAASGVDVANTMLVCGPRSPMGDTLPLRTRFCDDVCLDATDVSQVVVLACGLDARGVRLGWRPDTVVYELDTASMLAFRESGPIGSAVTPWQRRPVAADLREDWPAALRGAGFDDAASALWVVEGLLGYLPPAACVALLDVVSALSAPGSRIALEDFHPTAVLSPYSLGHYRSVGAVPPPLDMTGDRITAVEQLTALGWRVSSWTVADVARRHGRPVPANYDPRVPGSAAAVDDRYRFVDAVLPSSGD